MKKSNKDNIGKKPELSKETDQKRQIPIRMVEKPILWTVHEPDGNLRATASLLIIIEANYHEN